MEYSNNSIGVKILRIEQDLNLFNLDTDTRVYLMKSELHDLIRHSPYHPYIFTNNDRI